MEGKGHNTIHAPNRLIEYAPSPIIPKVKAKHNCGMSRRRARLGSRSGFSKKETAEKDIAKVPKLVVGTTTSAEAMSGSA